MAIEFFIVWSRARRLRFTFGFRYVLNYAIPRIRVAFLAGITEAGSITKPRRRIAPIPSVAVVMNNAAILGALVQVKSVGWKRADHILLSKLRFCWIVAGNEVTVPL